MHISAFPIGDYDTAKQAFLSNFNRIVLLFYRQHELAANKLNNYQR